MNSTLKHYHFCLSSKHSCLQPLVVMSPELSVLMAIEELLRECVPLGLLSIFKEHVAEWFEIQK